MYFVKSALLLALLGSPTPANAGVAANRKERKFLKRLKGTEAIFPSQVLPAPLQKKKGFGRELEGEVGPELKQTFKFVELDTRQTSSGTHFGDRTAIEGDYAIITAHTFNNNQGVAYVMKKNDDGTAWELVKTLTSSSQQNFGAEVAMSGSRYAVAATTDSALGSNAGAVYIYDSADDWTEKKIVASDAQANLYFGHRLAIDGDWVAVGGTSKSVYLFYYDSDTSTWTEEQKIDVPCEIFGKHGVELHGDWLTAGCTREAIEIDGVQHTGALYIFKKKDDNTWDTTFQKIVPETPTQWFGYRVQIDGSNMVVGTQFKAAYVYSLDTGTQVWSNELVISPSDLAADLTLWAHVGISGNKIILGGGNAESFYLYTQLESGGWGNEQKIEIADASTGKFGNGASITSGWAVIGEPFSEPNSNGNGLGRVFFYSTGSIATLVSNLAFNNDCGIAFNAVDNVSLTCSCTTTEGETSTAEILKEPCSNASNNNFSRASTGGTVVGNVATATIEFSDHLTAGEKESGSFHEYFCMRCDVFRNDGTNDVSIHAVKYDIDATLIYEQTGTFQVENIATSDFAASTANADSTRPSAVTAYRCNPNGDGSDDSGNVEVGDTLAVCVYSADADVSLAVTSLKLAKSDDSVLTSPIVDSVKNFVTDSTTATRDFGNGSRTVQVVKTLMVPSIFDSAGGETIKATGTVGITYNRRLESAAGRFLQASAGEVEEGTFGIEFELSDNEMPAVAAHDYNAASIAAYAAITVPAAIAMSAAVMM